MSYDSHKIITPLSFMENESNEQTPEVTPEETPEETPEVTPEETPDVNWEAKFKEQQGINKRLKTKLAKKDETPPTEEKPPVKKADSKSDEEDYAQLSYMSQHGIDTNSDDQIDFVKKTMKLSGLSLKDVLKEDFLKKGIKEIADNKTVEVATPSNSKRGQSTSGKNSVEYWLKKGDRALPEDRDLRIKVVNARLDKMKNKDIFANQSVIRSSRS